MNSQNQKIFLWNCRGAASTAFHRSCKYYLDIHKPEVIVIMETRVDPEKLRNTFMLLGFDNMHHSQCRGFAGGIVVAWKMNDVNMNVEITDFQFIHLTITFNGGPSWKFTAVYASPREELRMEGWRKLQNISQSMSGSWMIAGDFNDIASQEEKKGGAPASARKCNNFLDNINKCKLMDMGSVGTKFTWRGPLVQGHDRIFERLDRAMCNDEWRIMFPEAIVKVLTRIEFSDHHPIIILLQGTQTTRRKSKFRFEKAWMYHESYVDTVKQYWDAKASIPEKVIHLSEEFTKWKRDVFGSIHARKGEFMARIGGIQRKLHINHNNKFLAKLEREL
jgi:exonuclease III